MPPKHAPPLLLQAFEAVLPADARVERRKLFGNPCGFVNGNMFTGLHEDQWIVRLSEPQRAKLLGMDGASIFEPMKGRPMLEYVRVPSGMFTNPRQLKGWVKRAFDYCATLPPKDAKRPPKDAKRR